MTEMSDLCYLQKPRLTTNVTSRGGNFAETSKSTIQSFSKFPSYNRLCTIMVTAVNS